MSFNIAKAFLGDIDFEETILDIQKFLINPKSENLILGSKISPTKNGPLIHIPEDIFSDEEEVIKSAILGKICK